MHFIQAPDDHPHDVVNRVSDVLSFCSEMMTSGLASENLTLTVDAQSGFDVIMRACIGSLKRIQEAPLPE